MEFNMPDLTETQKVNMNILTLNTAVNDVQEDVRKLNKVVLEGNGELPLREQVRNHSQFINEFRYWWRFVIGLVMAQLVAFTIASIVAYLKFLPILQELAARK